MQGVSETVEKRIVIKVEGIGISETDNAIARLQETSNRIDTTRLSSMVREIRSLGGALNGVYNFKGFTSGIREIMTLVSTMPTDFSGFSRFAEGMVPMVGAMQTLSGGQFSVGSLREEILKLIELGNLDFSKLTTLSENIRTFAGSVSGIIMPVIDVKSIYEAVNKLSTVSLLPTEGLRGLASNIRAFIEGLAGVGVDSGLGSFLRSIGVGLNSISSASAKDYSGLGQISPYLESLYNSLSKLSATPSINRVINELLTLKTAGSGMGNIARELDSMNVSVNSLGRSMGKDSAGLKLIVSQESLANLREAVSLLERMAMAINQISTQGRGVSGLFRSINRSSTTMSDPANKSGHVLNKKTWTDTSGAIHGTNRALHFFRTALTTIGFTYFMRLIRESIDEFIELRSRILLTSETIGDYRESLNGLFQIAEDTRSAIGGLSRLFNKFHISLKPFGATVQQSSAFVKALAQSIKISGANAQETKAFYVQFGQAIQSGLLRGREFRSMLESNLYMSRLLAGELAGGDLGKLKEMAFKGQLDTLTVTNAVLRNQAKINKDFERVSITISDMFGLIKNELVKVMLNWNYVIGQSNWFIGTLGYIKKNLEGIVVLVTAFVGTTMVKLLAQFGLLATLIKGTLIGLSVLAIRKMYQESERFRKSITDSAKYFKELLTGGRDAGNGIAGQFDKLILKFQEFYNTVKDADWDLAFLSLEEQLVKIMTYFDALMFWKPSKTGLGFKDAFGDLLLEAYDVMKGVGDFVTGNESSSKAKDNIKTAMMGIHDAFYEQLGSYDQLSSDLRSLRDKRDGLQKQFDDAGKNFGGKLGEVIGYGMTREEIADLRKSLSEQIKDADNDVETMIQMSEQGLADLNDSINKYSSYLWSDSWLKYDDYKSRVGESPIAMMTASTSDILGDVSLLESMLTQFYGASGNVEDVASSVAKRMNEIKSATQGILQQPTPSMKDFKSGMTEMELELQNQKEYFDNIRKNAKANAEAKDEAIKAMEELAKPITQEKLLTGLFTKWFKATPIETDLTWTPNLQIKPKKVVVQDWIMIDAFTKSLEDADTAEKIGSMYANTATSVLKGYFDKVRAYWEVKNKETVVMSKKPEDAKTPDWLAKEISQATSEVREWSKNLENAGIDLQSYYDRLYKTVALVRSSGGDDNVLKNFSEVHQMLSSIVDVADSTDKSIEGIMSGIETAFTPENMFKSLRELVATGAKFEIGVDFYGKVGSIEDILPGDYDRLKGEFPDIFSKAYENADQLKDVIIQIMNLYKYEEYQAMTGFDNIYKGFRDAFQSLYDQYRNMTGLVQSMTVTIFEGFAEESNKFFLGLQEDWRGFVENTLKMVSDTAFKMMLFGEEGLLSQLGGKNMNFLVDKPEETIDSAIKSQIEGVGTSSKLASSGLTDVSKSALSISTSMKALDSSALSIGATFAGLETVTNTTASSIGRFSFALDALATKINSIPINTGTPTGTGTNPVAPILGILGSAPGGKQIGGGVKSNEPVWVGESGRELFVPSTSGQVYNNTASEAKAKNSGDNNNGVSIINFTDRNELDAYLNSPQGKKSILNIVSGRT